MMIQLPSGRIIDEANLTIVDIPEPTHRPVAESGRHVGDPEMREVQTRHGTRLMWVQRVMVWRRYADWTTLRVDRALEPASFLEEEATSTAATFDYVHHRGGTWGSSWWELVAPTQTAIWGPEEKIWL